MTTPRKQVHTESSANPATNKHVLRRRLLDRRRARDAEESRRLAEAIAAVGLELPPLRRAGCVALYTSAAEEPGTEPLRAGLRRLGTRVLLPVVRPDEKGREPARLLDWVEDTGGPPSPGAYNLPEPPGPRLPPDEIGAAAVVVVPALAVDTAGTRLGRGGGYYDRALALASPDALVLALVHDDELFASDGADAVPKELVGPLPCEEHDVPVGGVLTPSRWMLLTAPNPTHGVPDGANGRHEPSRRR